MRFIKSDFSGILPTWFEERKDIPWWQGRGAMMIPKGMNDLNKEVMELYVSEEKRKKGGKKGR